MMRVLRQRAALGRIERRELARVGGEDGVLAGDPGHQRYLTVGSSQA